MSGLSQALVGVNYLVFRVTVGGPGGADLFTGYLTAETGLPMGSLSPLNPFKTASQAINQISSNANQDLTFELNSTAGITATNMFGFVRIEDGGGVWRTYRNSAASFIQAGGDSFWNWGTGSSRVWGTGDAGEQHRVVFN